MACIRRIHCFCNLLICIGLQSVTSVVEKLKSPLGAPEVLTVLHKAKPFIYHNFKSFNVIYCYSVAFLNIFQLLFFIPGLHLSSFISCTIRRRTNTCFDKKYGHKSLMHVTNMSGVWKWFFFTSNN